MQVDVRSMRNGNAGWTIDRGTDSALRPAGGAATVDDSSGGTSPSSAPMPARESQALTREQMQALHAARHDGRKVVRAARVAAFSGWTLATFASITLLFGIFSLSSLLLGLGMAVVARVELVGSRDLRRLKPAAARRLAVNQLALGAMLLLYGGWGIYVALAGPGPYDEQLASGGEVAEMLEPIAALHTMITVAVYGGLGLGAMIATACTSLYYLTRRGHVEAYLQRTPDWIVATMRAVA